MSRVVYLGNFNGGCILNIAQTYFSSGFYLDDCCAIQLQVFLRIANEVPSNSNRHSKSKHNAIPRSKHFYFLTCKPPAVPPGKLALLLC